jgi:hypothetical protein
MASSSADIRKFKAGPRPAVVMAAYPKRPSGVTVVLLCSTLLLLSTTVYLSMFPSGSDMHSTTDALNKLMAPRTAAAIMQDEVLARNVLALLGAGADVTQALGKTLELPDIEKSGQDLELFIRRRSMEVDAYAHGKIAKRESFLDWLGGLFGSKSGNSTSGAGSTGSSSTTTSSAGSAPTSTGTGSSNSAVSTTTSASASSTSSSSSGGGLGSILGGLGSDIISAISGLLGGGNLKDLLPGAGLFLGIGIGEGTAEELNLATTAAAQAAGDKVASDNNVSASTLNTLIRKAGVGVSGSLIGALMSGSTLNIVTMAAPALLGLGQGIGDGTAMGLKLTDKNLAPSPSATDVPGIAANLGFGISKEVATNLANSDMSAILAKVLPDVAPALLGLGEGLGSGAAMGLKLAKVDLTPNPKATDIPGIAANFGWGLSKTVADNINMTEIEGSVGFSSGAITKYLPAAASGLGKGLGAGIPIGLGIQPEYEVALRTMSDGSLDVQSITENFAIGLSSGFVGNGTLAKMLAGLGSSDLGLPIDSMNIGRIAQGLARGLVQGAADTVESMGGVEALINGSAKIPADIPDSIIPFDDSVGGAATGFGLGLSSESVLAIWMLIKAYQSSNVWKSATTSSSTKSTPALPASTSSPAAVRPRDIPASGLAIRQDVITSLASGFNLTVLINADGISALMQKGVDALTCPGVGGLVLVGRGLMATNGEPLSSDSNTTKLINGLLPEGNLRLENGRTTYEIDPRQVTQGLTGGSLMDMASGVWINGNPLKTFIGFVAVHGKLNTLSSEDIMLTYSAVAFSIMVLLNILPFILGAEGLRNMLERARVRMPPSLNKVPKASNTIWMFVIAPTLLIVLIFGIITAGSTAHFRTAHGVSSSSYLSTRLSLSMLTVNRRYLVFSPSLRVLQR